MAGTRTTVAAGATEYLRPDSGDWSLTLGVPSGATATVSVTGTARSVWNADPTAATWVAVAAYTENTILAWPTKVTGIKVVAATNTITLDLLTATPE